jgi:hypothetical protein
MNTRQTEWTPTKHQRNRATIKSKLRVISRALDLRGVTEVGATIVDEVVWLAIDVVDLVVDVVDEVDEAEEEETVVFPPKAPSNSHGTNTTQCI